MPDPVLPGAPLAPSPRPTVPDELRRVAAEFEAIFLSEMLEPMFAGIDTEGLGGGGLGEELFRPMLIERYALSLSQVGGVGIADSIVRELMRLQETVVAPVEENADGAAG